MRAIIVALSLLFVACGPPELPYFTGRVGEPCPGYNRVSCDLDRPTCVLYCLSDDAGVWETGHCEPTRCGAGLSTNTYQDAGTP